jgi:hypothetical protein
LRTTRSTVICAAAVAVIALVPAASAVKLPGRAKYVGKTGGGESVQLRLTHDAKRVARMRIHYRIRCSDKHSEETYTVVYNVRVHNRHFRSAGSYTGSRNGSTNRYKVVGTLSRRRASGTFRLTNVAKRVRCHTGRLRWHARRVG